MHVQERAEESVYSRSKVTAGGLGNIRPSLGKPSIPDEIEIIRKINNNSTSPKRILDFDYQSKEESKKMTSLLQ